MKSENNLLHILTHSLTYLVIMYESQSKKSIYHKRYHTSLSKSILAKVLKLHLGECQKKGVDNTVSVLTYKDMSKEGPMHNMCQICQK